MFGAMQAGFFMSKASAEERTISLYHYGFKWKSDYSFTNPVNGQNYTFHSGEDLTRIYFRSRNLVGFCIEPGARIEYGTTFGSGDTNYWAKLGNLKRLAVSRALLYGYPNNVYYDTPSADWWQLGDALTQIVVWEYVLGYRDTCTNACTNHVLINNLHVPSEFQDSYMYYYDKFDSMLVKSAVMPSFLSSVAKYEPTYTLKYNSNSGDYETTLYDTNDTESLSDINFSADGLNFEKLDSRTLKISTRNIIEQTAPAYVTATKNIPIPSTQSAMAVWSASDMQNIVTGSRRLDPYPAFMRIQTESAGNLTIQKHSEDGIVSGRSFRISGNGVDKTVTTDSSGNVTIPNLIAGPYQVEETNTPVQYNQPDTQTAVVLPGRTVTATFTNSLKKGRVKFVKQDSYSGGYLSGAVYRIYKSDGTDVTELKSDADQLLYSPYLPYGEYYIQEIKSPPGFALDSNKHPFSITENEQIIPETMEDAPLSDVYPTYFKPNATYRSGTQIIASYLIHNNSYAEHAPDRPLTVHFSAYYYRNGARLNITEQQNSVVVPRNDENLTWFKVKIPSGVTKIYYTCTIDTPSGVVETNTENNTDNQAFDVSPSPNSQTPNTKFENVPSYFSRPDDNAEVPTGNYATNVTPSATWQQWVYADGAWSKKTYGMTLSADQQIAPDVNAFSSFQAGGQWHMKSGYGLSLTANTSISRYGSSDLPDAGAYVLPQNGNAYFPEFGYEFADGKYRTLQLTASNKLEFETNPYSITAQGEQDGRRIHYTPLWYPDGNYTVKTYLYDCWTPSGMISLQSTLSPIVIGSNIYDDWFINHK